MARKTVVSLFQTPDLAEATIHRLEAAGIARGDVSLVTQDAWTSSGAPPLNAAPGDQAAAGTTVPAGGVAVPAVGALGTGAPAIAAVGTGMPIGTTSAAADHAVAGGARDIAGWLVSEGVEKDDANAYAERIRGGAALLVIACDEAEVDHVIGIIHRDGSPAVGPRQR